MSNSPEYSLVPRDDGEDSVGLLFKEKNERPSSETSGSTAPAPSWKRPRRWHDSFRNTGCLAAAVVSLLVTNAATFFLVLFGPRGQAPSCPLPLNQPPTGVARAVAHLATPPAPQLLNVTFYDYDNSIWRKHNSLEADAAWYEYTQVGSGIILISKEDAIQAAINPDRHVYLDYPEKGLQGYPVKMEAIHQMHCLNLLRMNLYYNYEHTKKTCGPPHCAGPEKYVQLHIDHCLEVIRLRLQCTADVGVTPLVWLNHAGRMTGDMARMHTCADYETIRKFSAEKTIPIPEPGEIKPKPGDFIVHDYI